jgi:uncharacterized protein (DUF427 family)
VSRDGSLLAESARPIAVFETGLPPRWYLPREDVSSELVESASVTHCPYKGSASYYSVKLPGGRTEEDLAWYYEDPLPGMEPIAGRIAFYDERVDVEVDGEPQPRPRTRFAA